MGALTCLMEQSATLGLMGDNLVARLAMTIAGAGEKCQRNGSTLICFMITVLNSSVALC